MQSDSQSDQSVGSLEQLWERIRGQSPVIGVILMVAIVVILAAVVAAFVLGQGGDEEEPGLVSLDVEVDAEGVTVSHQSGDTLDTEEVEVIVESGGERDTQSLAEIDGTIEDFRAGTRFEVGAGELDNIDTLTGEIDVIVTFAPTESILFDDTFTVDPEVIVKIDDVRGESPVTVGDSIEVDVFVNNQGTEDQEVELILDGTTEPLDPVPVGESDTITQSFDSADLNYSDGIGITADADADSGFDSLDLAPPDFDVSFDADEDNNEVAVTITNNGDIGDEDDVTVDVNGVNDVTDPGVEINGTETFEQTFTDVSVGEGDLVSVEFAGEQSERELGAASFGIQTVDIPDEPIPSDEFDVDATIENIEDDEGERDISLLVGGDKADTEELTLEGGESEEITLTYDGPDLGSSPVNVEVDSEDDSETFTLEVDAPEPVLSNLDVAGAGSDATITEGDDEDISVDVENVGDQTGEFSVDLSIDSVSETETVEVGAGETETVTFEDVTGSLSAGSYLVNVSTDGDSISGSLTVEAPPEPELSGLDIAGQGSSATITEGDDEDIQVDVTNVGDQTGEFTVTLNSPVSDSDTVTVSPGGTSTATFSGVTGGLGDGSYSVQTSTNGESETGSLTVEPAFEPECATEQGYGDGEDAGEFFQFMFNIFGETSSGEGSIDATWQENIEFEVVYQNFNDGGDCDTSAQDPIAVTPGSSFDLTIDMHPDNTVGSGIDPQAVDAYIDWGDTGSWGDHETITLGEAGPGGQITESIDVPSNAEGPVIMRLVTWAQADHDFASPEDADIAGHVVDLTVFVSDAVDSLSSEQSLKETGTTISDSVTYYSSPVGTDRR